MDERRRLQRVAGPFVAEVRPGNAPQILIDQRQQSVERTSIALTPRLQKDCYLLIRLGIGHWEIRQ